MIANGNFGSNLEMFHGTNLFQDAMVSFNAIMLVMKAFKIRVCKSLQPITLRMIRDKVARFVFNSSSRLMSRTKY
jgi:hypothetical protein